MSVYSFQVSSRGGSTSFLYTVEDKSPKAALKQVREKYTEKTHNIVSMGIFDGTLEDYLGRETIDRIEARKTRSRDGAPPKKRSYAAIKKAAEK